MRGKLSIIVLNVLVTVLFVMHTAGIFAFDPVARLEKLLYDARVWLTLPGGVDQRIVIVDIDEDSLRQEGHWPWSRDKLRRLTDALFDTYGVATLGFDVVFAEKDESFDIEALRELGHARGAAGFVAQLDELAPLVNRDRLFAEGLAGRPTVLGYYFNINPERTESAGALPAPVMSEHDIIGRSLFPPRASSFGGNLPLLQREAAAAGFFSNPLVDPDGIVRRIPTLHAFEGELYESFSLAVARIYLGVELTPELANKDPGAARYPHLEALNVGPLRVPVDANGGVLVPYRGHKGSFPYVPAADVLRGTVADPELLRDAIALVGTTSLGLVDLRSTPIQAAFPGIEIHANVVAGLLDGNLRHRPTWTRGAELALVAALGLIMAFACPWLGPLRLWLFSATLFLALCGLNVYLWSERDLVMPLAQSALVLIVLYVLNVMYGFFAESKQKRQVRAAFGHYLAPALVEQLVEDPKRLRLEGEAREMTFLFSDIAGFTSFTERTGPEVLVSLLNEYLDGMCQIVMAHGGTIDKIVGDAIHAIFNAPIDQPDHAERAVRCALEMDAHGERFVAEKRGEGVDFGMTRIGLNTGTAIVGNFGGAERFDYTAHGDAINTAARMESVNKHLGTRICVAGTTVAQCPKLHFRPVAGLVLKGKTEAVEAFEPVPEQAVGSPRLQGYLRAYALLAAADPGARSAFEELAQAHADDAVIALHRQRLAEGESGAVIVLAEK